MLPLLPAAPKPESRGTVPSLGNSSAKSSSSASSDTASTGSPPLLPTPMTLPTDDFHYKEQLSQLPEDT